IISPPMLVDNMLSANILMTRQPRKEAPDTPPAGVREQSRPSRFGGSDADTRRAVREDGQAVGVLQEARNRDRPRRGRHHLSGPDTNTDVVLPTGHTARKYPSSKASGADHHWIPGSGAVLPRAHPAVFFPQTPDYARGFRIGNNLARARKNLPSHGIKSC